MGRPRVVHPVGPIASEAPLTYEPFYGLNEKPFSLSFDPKFIYRSASYDRVAQEVVDALGRRDEIVVVTGDMGIGKTTLCRSMVPRLDRRTLTSLVADPAISVEDLLKRVLVDFGVIEDAAPDANAPAARDGLTQMLREFVASLAPLQAAAVVIIDDAHRASAELFASIRDLANGADGRAKLHVVLVGESGLLERDELQWLRERIAVRARLEPLSAEEIAGYVAYRLAVAAAGASARVEFDDGAVSEIYAATYGVPRLVNLVCDRALARGQEAAASVIDRRLVAAAAADLDLGPSTSGARRVVQTVAAGVVLLLLALAGAGAAAWVFRDAVARTVSQWEAVPPVLSPPIRVLRVPIVPIPPPPDDEPSLDER
jgi:general secretion pathway protein A